MVYGLSKSCTSYFLLKFSISNLLLHTIPYHTKGNWHSQNHDPIEFVLRVGEINGIDLSCTAHQQGDDCDSAFVIKS